MNFSVDQKALTEALSNVVKAVADKSAIAALEGIKFSVEKDSLTLTGYDLEIGIRTTIPAVSDKSTDFVLNSKLICPLISKLPECDVRFDIIKEDGFSVRITGKKIVTTIGAISAEEYPNIPEYDRDNGFEIESKTLKNMINMTKFAVATSDTKPILTGELFEIKDGSFNMVSLDGYRLAVRTEKINTEKELSFVIKLKSLQDIVSLIKDKKTESDTPDMVKIFVGKKSAAFEMDGYLIHTRLLEGEFHQYRRAILPEERVKTTVRINVSELTRSLERCQLLIEERIKSPVRMTVKDDHIEINCKTPKGEIIDDVPCEKTGADLEIGFNATYMISALRSSESDEVKFKLADGVSPMIVAPVDGDNYLFLVLPIRLY
jgi:DNA polymerase-3 subunit beta